MNNCGLCDTTMLSNFKGDANSFYLVALHVTPVSANHDGSNITEVPFSLDTH